jgi:nucleolar protein 15
MSKTLHSVGVEKGKQKKQAKNSPAVEKKETSTVAPVSVADNVSENGKGKKRKLDQKLSNNEKQEKENTSTELTVQPNQKKVKLSTTNLRPLSSSSSTRSGRRTQQKDSSRNSSVIYLGHVPKGFEEDEIRKFFHQFGKIKKMKLFRSKASNASKGYAFLQFENEEIASVVAGAMNGYFLMERQLVCHVIPKEQLHDGMFLQYSKSRELKKAQRDAARPHKKEKKSLSGAVTEGETGTEGLEGEERKGGGEGEEVDFEINDENFEEILAKHKAYTEKKQNKLNQAGIEYTIPVVETPSNLLITKKPASKAENTEEMKEEDKSAGIKKKGKPTKKEAEKVEETKPKEVVEEVKKPADKKEEVEKPLKKKGKQAKK